MAEIFGAVARYKSREEIEKILVEKSFKEIPLDEMEPTIRRACGREYRLECPSREELVKSLSGKDDEKKVSYGTICQGDGRGDGRVEYVGVHWDDLRIVMVDSAWVAKRRRFYEKNPLPSNPEDLYIHVEGIILNAVAGWSGPGGGGLGRSMIIREVADYCNVKQHHAQKMVDDVLRHTNLLERVDEDRWRVKSFAMKRPAN